MDLRLEAAAMSEMAENTRDDPGFRVPTVDWDRTAREVLPIAEKAGDQPTVDLLSARMEVHEKNAWMLRSLLEE